MQQRTVGRVVLCKPEMHLHGDKEKPMDPPGPGGKWLVECEPHVMIRLKRTFAKARERDLGRTFFHDTDEVCRDLLWFTDRFPMEWRASDLAYARERAKAYDQRGADYMAMLTGELKPREFELALPPREYQRLGAELAIRSGGLLVADDLGLGKTITAICALTEPFTRPALVVTMTHLQTQWARELEKFAPELSVHVIEKSKPYDIAVRMREGALKAVRKTSKKYDTCPTCEGSGCAHCAFAGRVPRSSVLARQQAWTEWMAKPPPFPDVVIINYHKLAKWAEVLSLKVRSVIYDECQELRRRGNPRTAKSAAAEHVSRGVDLRIGLSATPIYNYGGEIWNVLDVIRPDALGAKDEFCREWCKYGHQDDKAQIAEPKAFGAYVREAGLMLRRTREEVGRELPPLTIVPHTVDADPKLLDEAEDSAAELAQIILQQGGDWQSKGKAAMELDAKLRMATGLAKAPAVASFVKMLVESERKVLLCGWHHAVYEVWMSALKAFNPVFFTGRQTTKQKDRARDAFISGDSQVLVMSLRSGAGLDGLQGACNTIVFGELDWSPGVHEQCVGRVYRDMQSMGCVAYYLIADEGSDPIVADVLGVKKQQIAGIKDPDKDLVEKLEVDPNHVKKLAEHLLKKKGIDPNTKSAEPTTTRIA